MFTKNKTSWNNSENKSEFKRDIVGKMEINKSVDDTMNRNLKILKISVSEALRNVGTLEATESKGGRFAYITTCLFDAAKLTTVSDDVKKYSSEIIDIARENNVDYRIIAKEVTSNMFRKNLSDFLFRDVIPASTNSIIKNKVKLDTPLKKGIVDLNLVGLLGFGISEGLDKLIVSKMLKKYEKNEDKDHVVANLYYQGKFTDTEYSTDKRIEGTFKLINAGLQGAGTGIMKFLSSRSKMNQNINESNTINVLIYSTKDDSEKKPSPSTDKSSKINTKISKTDTKSVKK